MQTEETREKGAEDRTLKKLKKTLSNRRHLNAFEEKLVEFCPGHHLNPSGVGSFQELLRSRLVLPLLEDVLV